MTEKVKVTQEQADWLEKYESEEAIDYAIDIQLLRKRPDSPIVDWHASMVAKALYNGYEVETDYKVGDWVVIEDCPIKKYSNHITQIQGIMSNGFDFKEFWFHKNNLLIRHATPEEIKAEKERRLWAEIDRPVGKFVIGDIGIAVDDTYAYSSNFIEALYHSGELKGFYPAESFISFEDGGSND